MTTTTATGQTLLGVQYLRALAAIMVVVYHLAPQLGRMGYAGHWPEGLAAGVDIFFVISGLIMWVTTSNRPVTPGAFWRKRLVRIAPLYWVVTSLFVVLMIAAPHVLQTGRFALGHVVASYLFLPAQHPVTLAMEPVLIPGWTLNYEMIFYLIFGLFVGRSARVRFLAPASILIGLVLIGVLFPVSGPTVMGFYTSGILVEFVFGMAIGFVILRRTMLPRIAPAAALGMVAVGMAILLLAPLQTPRFIVWGIPALAVVTGVLALEARGRLGNWPWLHRLGDASYSIYLSHAVVLSVVSQLWRRLGLEAVPGGLMIFAIVGVAASIVGGLALFRWVETPLIAAFGTARREVAR